MTNDDELQPLEAFMREILKGVRVKYKPRIRRIAGGWTCKFGADDGYGATPADAYECALGNAVHNERALKQFLGLRR